jgi:hypothetical protein
MNCKLVTLYNNAAATKPSAIDRDFLATVNQALHSRKLNKPKSTQRLTPLELLRCANKKLRFMSIRAVRARRK